MVMFYFLIDEKLLKAVWIGDSKMYYFLIERFKPVFFERNVWKLKKNERKYISHSEK